MTAKTKFTLLWAGGGLIGVASLLGVSAPFIFWWLGDTDEHGSNTVRLAYSFLPLLPFAIAAVFLLLGLFGKLPGTKTK
jgi:hypothetical protein